MTTLYISEFSRQSRDGSLQVAPIVNVSGGVVSSQVAYTTAASVQSNALATGTAIVRIIATSDCFIKVGVNPTADTTGIFIPADSIEYFGVDSTVALKIAVKGA